MVFKKKKSTGQSVIPLGIMEADAIFNPGVKHRVEIIQKNDVAFHQEYNQVGGHQKDGKPKDT